MDTPLQHALHNGHPLQHTQHDNGHPTLHALHNGHPLQHTLHNGQPQYNMHYTMDTPL